jgi:hypothetical protein
MHDNNPIDYR